MNFLVDAHLPRRFAYWLREAGHDALHTLNMPDGNRTTDAQINARAAQENRVVITKDADFVNTHLLYGQPAKLLIVSTGNIANAELERLVRPNLAAIVVAFEAGNYLELTRTRLIVHA